MTLAPSAGHVSQHTHIEAIRASQQGYIEIGAIAGDPDDIRHKRYIQRWLFLTGDNTADLLLLIDQLAAKYGNVYCSRVLYEQPRRDRALALPTRLLFLDDAPPGSYTYTVETSPNSMHAYILLDELISPDQAEQLGRRLAYQQGADPGGWDITQLVRVPGTLNTKAQAGGQYDDHNGKRRWIPGTGHQITLTKRTGRAYSLAEITEATQNPALPIDALDPSSVAIWQGNLADLLTPDGLPKRWKNPNITGWKVLRGDIHTKSSSEARYHIIASLVLHGYPDDEIAALGIHLTNFGKMETKGSKWLYRDIARCTRKARQEFADRGKVIIVNPSRPSRTRAPADLPQRTPATRGRKCKGSPAAYYAHLLDQASGDRVLWSLSQAAVEMAVSVATIKRWEVILKAHGQIERVTVSTRQHSYLAILGQLKIHESTPNQAPLEVSSQIELQSTETPPNDDRAPNAWENHRGASLPPVASTSSTDDQIEIAGASFESLADDQAASYEPLNDLAVATGRHSEPVGDDQAEVAGASCVPFAANQAASHERFDVQADPAGARFESLADDQAGIAGASYNPAADQIAVAVDSSPARRRKRKDPIRARLDKRRKQVERWRAMDLAELEIERRKLAGAAQDRKRSAKQRQVFAEMVPQLDHEIGQKRSAGIRAMYQAANAANAPVEPPPIEQAAPVAGVVRRVWRSPVVRLSEYADPLPLPEVPPREHPIATLGIDAESMRAAHDYCAAVLARVGESGTESAI